MNQLALYENKGVVTPLFDNKKLDLLKTTICRGATDEEFELFLHACQRTGLDPFMRQIYSVKRWDSNLKRETMTIQTGIDGYRLIADRTGRYSPGKEPTYHYDQNGKLISATAYVEKLTPDGKWHTVAATAHYDEYCQRTKEGKPTRFWSQMPHVMLGKVAEALALRKAFPGDLSGLYTKEEMQQADIEEIATNSDSRNNVEHIPESSKPKIIEKHQWTELNQLIDQCDSEFQEKLWDFLKHTGIQSFAEMDEQLYNKLKKKCIANISTRRQENATC